MIIVAVVVAAVLNVVAVLVKWIYDIIFFLIYIVVVVYTITPRNHYDLSINFNLNLPVEFCCFGSTKLTSIPSCFSAHLLFLAST